jgi:glycosyltransferase involved in cell wall biosynthesis
VDLLIIDDIVPSTFSPFRTLEYRHYLSFFDCAVLSLEGWHLWIENTRCNELAERFPVPSEKRRRLLSFTEGHDISAQLAYVTFLNNAHRLMPYFNARNLPFILQLYPGGGFEINQPQIDEALRQVLLSDLCRCVIVTQTITRDYILNRIGCDPKKVAWIFGGVFDSRVRFDFLRDKQLYPTHKSTIDLCFVAQKYVPDLSAKGYDQFVEIARRLAPEDPRLRFHVVGNYEAEDLPLGEVSERFTFYGRQDSTFFDTFYPRMDVIISVNRPFVAGPGAFDGFPTGACIEAGFRGVLNCISDPLNLNIILKDGEDFLLLNDDTDRSVSLLREVFGDPSRLYALAYANWRKLMEVFNVDGQLWARSRLIVNELSKRHSIYLPVLKGISHLDAGHCAGCAALVEQHDRNIEANARLSGATAALTAIQSSTSWRITQPLRRALNPYPKLALLLRRGTKLIWWTITLQLTQRMQQRRQVLPSTIRDAARRQHAPMATEPKQ